MKNETKNELRWDMYIWSVMIGIVTIAGSWIGLFTGGIWRYVLLLIDVFVIIPIFINNLLATNEKFEKLKDTTE